MHIAPNATPALADEELWRRSRAGDRDAFGRIVERHQNLVCAVAYSASGSLARAEDLAQETFITAWQRIADLRDPAKLRAWLCGIARNLAASAHRKEQRRAALSSLEDAGEPVTHADDPAVRIVSQEEEALLWNTLSRLPATYREPLVLYYRHGESISAVASALELSDAAVKQRLSRGRALLRSELTGVMQSVLERSRPGLAFTTGVLAALPAAAPPSATAAVLASVATGEGAGTKGALGALGHWVLLGPAIGLLAGLLGTRAAASTARSEGERRVILRHARHMVIFCWVMSIGLAVVLSQAGHLYPVSPVGLIAGALLWTGALLGVVLITGRRLDRDVVHIRAATGTGDEAFVAAVSARGGRVAGPLCYRSRIRVLGLPLVHVASGDIDGDAGTRRAIGWLAVGDVAVSPLFAFGGFAVAPIACGGVTVGLLSLSLWGIALGVIAFGSIAVGFRALGLVAVGWDVAVGGAAVAHDYALGVFASAAQTDRHVVEAWLSQQWFSAPLAAFAFHAHWIILAAIAFAIGRLVYRARLRRDLRPPPASGSS
jgi:RNA polymerase sigma factor (sigma-70 family)